MRLSSIVFAALLASSTFAAIPTPSEHLKIQVGADRVVADYRQIRDYFRMLDAASPRVQVVSLGSTTLGEEMIMAVISSEKNIQNLARIREISHRLADPRGLDAAQIDALAREGKAVVLVTCNIHSTEIGSSQMAMEWAHALANADDEVTTKRLDDVVLLLVPSLNPDGQIMESEWYRKYVGTPFEGGPMPRLYHHYVGHDNNRDWFMLTQKETRNMSRAVYHEWFPQVFVDEHQMGSEGPRIFVPPFADPLDPDVHPLIMREIALIGTNMAFRLEQNDKSGVISRYQFDAYLLGTTRNTGWWKNITGLLTETASARFASPIYIDPSELRGGEKGLADYQAQTNFPNPWKGGWWRLRDIMDYNRIVSDAILEVASERRYDLLRNIARRANDVVGEAKRGEGYLIRRSQRDYPTARRLAQLMADHNVDVYQQANGDYWIPLTQPYGRFVRELMEPQRYPATRAVPGADVLEPYDVVSWTLPLSMGVTADKIVDGSEVNGMRLAAAFERPARSTTAIPTADLISIDRSSPEAVKVVNAALKGGGNVTADATKFYLDANAARAAVEAVELTGVAPSAVSGTPPAKRVRAPRVAIYKPWFASIDEGWTRWILEQYGFAPSRWRTRR